MGLIWKGSLPSLRSVLWAHSLFAFRAAAFLAVTYLVATGVAVEIPMGRENIVSVSTKFETVPEIQAARWIDSHTEPNAIIARAYSYSFTTFQSEESFGFHGCKQSRSTFLQIEQLQPARRGEAMKRHFPGLHSEPKHEGIFLVRVDLGWTVIGWLLAFYWAIHKLKPGLTLNQQLSPPPAGLLCSSCARYSGFGSGIARTAVRFSRRRSRGNSTSA